MQSLEELYSLTAYSLNSSTEWYENFTHGNNTNLTDSQIGNQFILPWWRQMIWTVLFVGMIAVATGGNLIVIWIVMAHKRMRTVTNYFLVNLSIADAMVSTLNVTFNYTYMLNSHWTFGNLYCKISQFIAVLTICASVFTLMAISIDSSGSTGGELTQSTYPTSSPLESGQPRDDARNVNRSGESNTLKIPETTRPEIESSSLIRLSRGDNLTLGFTATTERANQLISNSSSSSFAKKSNPTGFSEQHLHATTGPAVSLTATPRPDGIMERLISTKGIGINGLQLSGQLIGRNSGLGIDISRVAGQTTYDSSLPTTIRTTASLLNINSLGKPDPSLPTASVSLISLGAGSHRESGMGVSTSVTPTSETASHEDNRKQTATREPNRLQSVSIPGNSPLPVVAQNDTRVDNGSTSPRIDGKFEDVKINGTLGPASGNSIRANARIPPEEIGKKLKDPNGKWTNAATSYAEVPTASGERSTSQAPVGKSLSTKEIERKVKTEKDRVGGYADGSEITTEPVGRTNAGVTKSDDLFSVTSSLKNEEQPSQPDLLRILRKAIVIEAARQDADLKLWLEIGKTARKMNDVNNNHSAVHNRENSGNEMDTYPPQSTSRNYGTSAASTLQFMQKPPVKLNQELLDHLWRFVSKTATLHDSDSNGSTHDVFKDFTLHRFPNSSDYEGPTYIFTVRPLDYPVIDKQEIVPPGPWGRVCRAVAIKPGKICKRAQTLCTIKYPGYQTHCRPGPIICNGNPYDYGTRGMKFICENRGIPTGEFRVAYSVPTLFPLDRICFRVEGKEDTLACIGPPGLEEVDEVYGKESAVKRRKGANAETPNFPEAMAPYILPTSWNFESSYSKEVPARRSYAAQPPEVAKETLLEAIRRMIRHEKHETSEKARVPPHSNVIEMPLASRSFNSDEPTVFANDSISSSPNSTANAANIDGSYTDGKNIVQREKNGDSALSDTINTVQMILNRQFSQPHEITKNAGNNLTYSSEANINSPLNDDIKLRRFTEVTKTDNKDAASQPTILNVPSTRTKLEPVESQPVAVTIDTQVFPETSTGTTSRNDKALTMGTDIVINGTPNFTVHAYNPNEILKEVMQKIAINPFGTSGYSNILPAGYVNEGPSVKGVFGGEKNDVNFTQGSHKAGDFNLSAHHARGSVHGFPINLPIGYAPASTASNIMVNEERYANTEINQNTNIERNHNANFNQGGAQSLMHEAIQMALPIMPRVQKPVRSIPFNKDGTPTASFIVNASLDNTNVPGNKKRGVPLSTNRKDESGALPRAMSQNVASRAINLSSGLHDAAATLGWIMNQLIDRKPQFAINQSDNVAREIAARRSVNGPHDSSIDSNNTLTMAISENWNRNTGTHNGIIPHLGNVLAFRGNFANNFNHRPRVNDNANNHYEILNKSQNTVPVGTNDSKVPDRHAKANTGLQIDKTSHVGSSPWIFDTFSNLTTLTGPDIRINPTSAMKFNTDYNVGTNEKIKISGLMFPGIAGRSVNENAGPAPSNIHQFPRIDAHNNINNSSSNKNPNSVAGTEPNVDATTSGRQVGHGTGKSSQGGNSAWKVGTISNAQTPYNDNNSNMYKSVIAREESLPGFGSFITGGMNLVGNLAVPAMKTALEQKPLNSLIPLSVIKTPSPIIERGIMVSASNSINGIAGARPSEPAGSMRRALLPLSQGLNLPGMLSAGTLGIASTANGNTSGMRNPLRRQDRSINTNYNSNPNYNTDSNYNPNWSHNAKHETTKTSLPATYDSAESLGSNVKHTRGWYELWFNSGDEDMNDKTEIWNNKKFKSFVEQFQQFWDGRNQQPKKNSTVMAG